MKVIYKKKGNNYLEKEGNVINTKQNGIKETRFTGHLVFYEL